MILTVTMNPCFDRYVYTPSLKHGKTNRITDEYYCAAGKGINVSKMLAALGINVLACGVACEDIIKTIENDLGEYRISSDFIKADGNTRVNMKIRDDSGVVTELSEGGLSVNADVEKRAYMHVTRLAENASLCVLSGSVPKGINGNFYFDVISRLKSIGCECVLDASGELLANRIKAGPAIVKPNLEEFEQLCRKAEESEDPVACLALYQQALELYRGDFLPKLSAEAWVIPISTYYHQLYLDIALKTLSILEEHGRWEEVTSLCEKALKIEAYDERIYQSLMRCKLALGDRSAVLSTYEEMSELLFSTFGVMPSDESRSLYRQAMRGEDSLAIPVGSVREDLKESGGAKGALFCEYDFFKILYQAQARALIRSGETIHIALFSVHGYGKKELSRRSLDRAMENLQELIVSNLRQGDIVTKCSVSQLIVMLPQANYENSCAVCQRLIKSFFRQYPHSPVDIHFSVQPLEPMEPSAEKTQRS